MKLPKHLVASAAALAAAAWLVVAGSAVAAFPNFSDCPRSDPTVNTCLDIQNTAGNLNIKGFNVPLGASLEIRGGFEIETARFVPPVGSTGFFATPVPVPGGLLGIEFPIPGNTVLATTELAGPPSGIHISVGEGTITLPIKVRLTNVLLGMNCHIGTDSNPVRLHLTTGTTSPPPPNRSISGHFGTVRITEEGVLEIIGNLNVENSFAIPGSSSCGLGLGLINALVNAKLKLPSAAGNNTIEVTNNLAAVSAH
jgi:hypothetical protein